MLLHMPATRYQLLTRQQTAEVLKSSVRLVDYEIANGNLPAVRIGRSVRVTDKALNRFIEAREGRAANSKRERK